MAGAEHKVDDYGELGNGLPEVDHGHEEQDEDGAETATKHFPEQRRPRTSPSMS